MHITERTFSFAVRIVKLCGFLDEISSVSRTLSRQVLRSGTSIGANVQEAQSAQSNKDFLHKLEIALKEARETQYWLKLLVASGVVSEKSTNGLIQESEELISILVSSTRKIKEKEVRHRN